MQGLWRVKWQNKDLKFMNNETKHKKGFSKIADLAGAIDFKSQDLETAFRAYINRVDEADRIWSPSATSQVCRMIVQIQDDGKSICGRLVEYEKGKGLEVIRRSITEAAKGSEVKDEAPPQPPNGYEQEIIDSSLFFSLKGNHIALMQSVTLQVGAFRDHLNWMLMNKPEGQTSGLIAIKDRIITSRRKLIEKHGVAEIFIGSNIEDVFGSNNLPEDCGTLDLVTGMFKGFFKSDSEDALAKKGFDHLRLFGIRTEVRLKAKTSAGAKTKELVDTLTLGLQENLAGLKITLSNGEVIKGESLVESIKFPVEHFDGRPAVTQIYTNLRSMLSN